jgi:hypothetical protein
VAKLHPKLGELGIAHIITLEEPPNPDTRPQQELPLA